MEEPKYLNEYINQILFDMGEIGPQHLNAMRVGLSAMYRRIKYVDISADLNEQNIDFAVKFRWWAIFTRKKKFLKRVRDKIEQALPKPVRVTDLRNGQPVIEKSNYDIRIGILGIGNRVKWIKHEEEKSNEDS